MTSLLEPRRAHDDEGQLSPEDRRSLADQLEAVQIEKKKALKDPGPTWREWFFYDMLKWWIGVGFLVLDSWVIAFWLEPPNAIGLALSLVAAIYLEFLLARYLWFRPKDETTTSRGAFRRTLLRPVEFGRWTPEAELVRRGVIRPGSESGPSIDEFA